MAGRKELTQAPIKIAAASASLRIADAPGALLPGKRSLIARVFDGALFILTLLVSVALVVMLALVTPFVILLSSLADLFDKDSAEFGWTTENLSENAR